MKKLILLLGVLSIFISSLSGGITVFAAEPSYMFNANYYSTKYPDLYNAFGNNKSKLKTHWNTYGKKEGRSPSPIYDPDCYLNNNGDLKNAFGTNYTELYNHFLTYGINEFRKSSPIYDGAYYKTHYADLQNAFGNNSKLYLEHFLNYGMKEGRQASADFNVHDYKSRYADLQNAFGNDLAQYYWHYMQYGIREGRDGSSTGRYSPAQVPDITSNVQKQNSVTTNQTNSTTGLTNETMSTIARRIGTQNQYKYESSKVMCTAFSMAYCRAYLFNDYREPTVYWKNGAGAVWSWGRGTKKSYKNNSQVLAAVKSQIDSGKPCIVRTNSSNGGHCIVAFKYSGSGTSTADFTVIDPWSAKIKRLNNYSIHSTSKYVVTF